MDNYGTITNCTVGDIGDYVQVTDEHGVFARNNYGTISYVTNNVYFDAVTNIGGVSIDQFSGGSIS